MVRGALIISLLLLFIFLGRNFSASWQVEDIPTAEAPVKAPQQGETFTKVPSPYPAVSKTVPDFNQGYLFNEARELSDSDTGEESENTEEEVQLSDLMYSGSIIVGAEKKGLISFTATTARPTRRSSMGRQPPARRSRASGSQAKHQQVIVGDEVGGYTVSEIHPDRIVFAKNGQTIEKNLYDAEKKRTTTKRRSSPPKQKVTIKKPPLSSGPTPETARAMPKETKSSSLRTQSSPALRRPRPQSASSPIPKGLRIPTGNINAPDGSK